MAVPPSPFRAVLFLLAAAVAAVDAIGVNYGILGDNLPPPAQVAQFLKDKTTIDRVKIFGVNADILQAFAGTGILVSVTIPNGEIPNLANIHYARRYIAANIKPFHPQTKFQYILVGNEILHWGPQDLRDNLVAAMHSVNKALRLEKITGVKVTTAHSLGILQPSDLPSLARFTAGWDKDYLAPILEFHRQTRTPFMVNPYPYFGYSPDKSDFALFRPNKGVYDKYIRRTYGNMFDLLLDSVYVSMKKLGFPDVEIAVGETGWASQGETYEQPKCSVANAADYNGGLVRHYNAGRGTPLMPKRRFETYIFALFNENQKTGSMAERNFGLFRPDFTAVYDVGIMRGGSGGGGGGGGAAPSKPTPAPPVTGSNKWCVPKAGATDAALQNNINYACGQGIDCQPIQPGGACFNPPTVRAHASFVMNTYYHAKGLQDFNCDFSGTGVVTSSDPSTSTCKYVS
ncbi:hypothetical protein ABFS82_06G077700 [Erythranthe guttata]|uniref:glucan endo-1,3-beta-D-glucosidase n=1 Tax=Erythranthe guttata TaxID=4155 RepID=A0A022PU59_ERYGU|nr:PREDICTED: glucan endo-1,3-beta-glucosidase-like [Erythranthe guttata]EYU19897.1 hypothetical protein MIMGU_mgv1a006105mg [Erythranthe guttata]|eukprot:XP_012858854.1 PREDICTED: glucan endo-1,3-beta-glucosidase-like [Erythranthe guttata]